MDGREGLRLVDAHPLPTKARQTDRLKEGETDRQRERKRERERRERERERMRERVCVLGGLRVSACVCV